MYSTQRPRRTARLGSTRICTGNPAAWPLAVPGIRRHAGPVAGEPRRVAVDVGECHPSRASSGRVGDFAPDLGLQPLVPAQGATTGRWRGELRASWPVPGQRLNALFEGDLNRLTWAFRVVSTGDDRCRLLSRAPSRRSASGLRSSRTGSPAHPCADPWQRGRQDAAMAAVPPVVG